MQFLRLNVAQERPELLSTLPEAWHHELCGDRVAGCVLQNWSCSSGCTSGCTTLLL